MKQLILLISLGLFVSQGRSQVQSSCTPSGNMERIYKNDAVRIAAAHLYQISSPLNDSVEVPSLVLDSVTRALYAMQNMGWTPTKDTIMNLFGFADFATGYPEYEKDSLHIHNAGFQYGYVNNKIIEVEVSNTASWYNAWLSGNYYNTPNADVNYLMGRFNLTAQLYYNAANSKIFRVISSKAINTIALKKKFLAIPGCPSVEIRSYVGDGNSITTTYESDGIVLTYRNGCGDCPAGCTYGRIWKFKVNLNSCVVTHISTENFGTMQYYLGILLYCTRGAVMPVIFSSVDAYVKNGLPVVEWKVASELNIDKYEIQRSTNGVQFSDAGYVLATRSSTSTAPYSWQDNSILKEGIVYYRVKAIERGGGSKYTQIVNVNLKKRAPAITVYPNPVENKILKLQLGTGNYTLSLFSIEGKRVYSKALAANASSVQLPVTLKSGTYILSIGNGKEQLRQTIVIR